MSTNRCFSNVLLTVLAAGACVSVASAQDAASPASTAAAVPASTAEASGQGILPLIDYSGDFSARPRLLGDWGGKRTELAKKGFMLDLDLTQTAQGVVSGGNRIDWDYNGSLELYSTLDLHRMNLVPGGLVRFRTEARFGETVNDDSGGLLPVNADGYFPITGSVNENIVSVTELNYTQFLGETFGLTLGKFQTLDGDPNEFAGGRGRSQFMNFSFLANPVAALTVPYSTLGGGLIWLPTKQITVSSLLVMTSDSSTTSGFDKANEGWTWVSEADFQYKLGSLPGGVNVGGTYAFANDFKQLNGKLALVPGQGVTLSEKSQSWAAYVSGWQYVYAMDEAKEPIKLTDGRPDLRGVGVFTRLGIADDETNPVHWAMSVGLGARGIIPSRDNDVIGLGYSYSEINNGGRFVASQLEDSTQLIEGFYNVALTPAAGLTFDVQWLDGVATSVKEAIVLGARLDLRF